MKLPLLVVGLFILILLIETLAIMLLTSGRSQAVRWAVAFELLLHRHQVLPDAPTLTLTHLRRRLRIPGPVVRTAIVKLEGQGFVKTKTSASNLECWLTPKGEKRICSDQ
jgi:hypothetical protein